jgi:hypothetical protein
MEDGEMSKQEWFCEVCREDGVISVRPDSSFMAVLNELIPDHREKSPSCTADYFSQVKIRNKHVMSVPEWRRFLKERREA